MVSGVGRPNGPARFGGRDGWFRYPAGFSDEAFAKSARALDGLPPGATVVDPFAGAAVGVCRLAEAGYKVRGLEANPLVAELAALKVGREAPAEADTLIDVAHDVSRRAGTSHPSTDSETDLVRACFSAEGLVRLVALRHEIQRDQGPWSLHLKWALLATLRDVSTSKVGWPYQRPSSNRKPVHRDPAERFIERVREMQRSLAGVRTEDVLVHHGDARASASWTRLLGHDRADACVSSPPYLNNYDYADATRLEAYFWGVAASWAELVRQVRAPMMTSTTQQTNKSGDQSARAILGEHPIWAELSELSARVTVERERRPRGKEYDQMLMMYLADASQVLGLLKRHLASRAAVAMVIGDSAPYGVYVDTPALWTSLAEALGFTAVSDEVIRQRGARWRTNGTRHQVALAERLVVWKAPEVN